MIKELRHHSHEILFEYSNDEVFEEIEYFKCSCILKIQDVTDLKIHRYVFFGDWMKSKDSAIESMIKLNPKFIKFFACATNDVLVKFDV